MTESAEFSPEHLEELHNALQEVLRVVDEYKDAFVERAQAFQKEWEIFWISLPEETRRAIEAAGIGFDENTGLATRLKPC